MAYIRGRGHMHLGPGTSMVQFSQPYAGMGACGSCESGSHSSLGACCASCAKGSNCSGSCKGGLMGMGLFDSTDFTTWGIAEWVVIGLGLYLVGSVVGDFGRTRKKVSRYRSRSKRKDALKRQLSEL